MPRCRQLRLGLHIKQCFVFRTWDNRIASILSIGTIILSNILFFHDHYAGIAVFPWDFFSSAYLGQTVAWFRDGSIFAPPKWLPYGSMGFPAWWSIQSGAWNLLLQLLSWAHVSYTLVNATIIQCLYVAAAGLGTIGLARLCGLAWPAATIAGLTYHFSSIFFSNQQHVDILRGAALLPFLLMFLHPNFLRLGALRVIGSGFVIWQFLVTCYPGQVVSGGLTAAFAVLFWASALERPRRIRYLVLVGIAGTCGVIMALAKWAPVILEGTSSLTQKRTVFGILPQHFVTLLFDYSSVPLPNDLTMRSLWVPPVLLLLAGYLRFKTVNVWLFATLGVSALFVGSLNFLAPELREEIGILTISRLPHSDWRPTLQLSMALLGAIAWQEAVGSARTVRDVGPRFALSLLVVFLLTLLAYHLEYQWSNLFPEALAALTFLIFVSLALLKLHRFRKFALVLTSIAFVVGASYLQHVVHVPQTWNVGWSKEKEIETFGILLSEIDSPVQREWSRRPSRQNYGVDLSVKGNFVASEFNRAWYTQQFSTFGYDNLGSSQWVTFFDSWVKEVGDSPLLAFMMHPSQTVLTAELNQFDIRQAANCAPARDSCSSILGASATMRTFGLSGSAFSIVAPRTLVMIENEMWYHGWRGRLCDAALRCRIIEALPIGLGLRGWPVPAGKWNLSTTYSPPYRMLGLAAAVIGVAMLLLAGFVSGALSRRTHKRTLSKPGPL